VTLVVIACSDSAHVAIIVRMGTAEDAATRLVRMMVLADDVRDLVRANTETSRAQLRTCCTELLILVNAEDVYRQIGRVERMEGT
jgi:hypothetical protein